MPRGPKGDPGDVIGAAVLVGKNATSEIGPAFRSAHDRSLDALLHSLR
jgi:hypothetical protein